GRSEGKDEKARYLLPYVAPDQGTDTCLRDILRRDPYLAQSWMREKSVKLPVGRFNRLLEMLPEGKDIDKEGLTSVTLTLKDHADRTLEIAIDDKMDDISMDETLIIGHKDLSDEFDLNNVLKIFDDSEKLIFRIVNEKEGVLDEGDMQRLATILGVSTYGDYGMADEIINSYTRLKRYHDCIIVGNQPRKNNDYKLAMMGHAYALRYQLSKKLSDLDLSDMNLTSFDFSYGRMENTLLRNGILTNACFFKTQMSGSNLEDCDIGGTMFKDCSMDKCSFNRSKVTSATFENVLLDSASFVEAEISSIHIGDIRLRDAAFTRSNVRSASFTEVNLDHSNFQESTLTDVTFGRCHMANSIFIGCTSSESTFDDSVLKGGNFRGAMMSNTTMTDSNFSECEFTDANVTSAMMGRSLFSNSSCENVNFTGSVLLACKFDTSLLSRSSFVKSFIGSWTLRPAERNWVAKDQQIIEHEQNLSSGVRSISHSVTSSADKTVPESTREHYGKVIRTSVDLITMEGHISLFDHSTMEDCLFTETEIADSMMRFVILSGSRFNSSRITNSSFEGSILNNMSVSKCALVNVNFDRTSWNGSTLSDVRSESCDFCNCSITDASFVSVAFRRCNVENTAFRGSKIIGCTFTDMVITDELLKVSEACEFIGCTFRGMSEKAMNRDMENRFRRCTFIDCAESRAVMAHSEGCTFHDTGAGENGTA
ncbi:MAG: pentapeptide repeat-containing protein, partial [archaeon]|nr:pentapeptide repeat-containing protein [archaeon]